MPLKIKSLFAAVDRGLAEERAVLENRNPNEDLLPMEHSSGRSKASFLLGRVRLVPVKHDRQPQQLPQTAAGESDSVLIIV